MAMMRVTFFFKDTSFGWTETYYHVSANTLPAAWKDAWKLGQFRIALCAQGCIMTHIRVSDDDIFRDSYTDTVSSSGAVLTTGQKMSLLFSERAYSTILMHGGTDDGLYRRAWYMSGIPDDAVTEPLDLTFPGVPNFKRVMDAFCNALSGGLWGFKVRDRNPNPGGEVKITDVSNDTTFHIQITAPLHGLVSGDRAIIRGIRQKQGMTPVRGVHQVDKIDDDTVVLKDLTGPVDYLEKGYIRLLKYKLVAFAPQECYPTGETHRKRGRTVYSQPRGRSRKARTVT